MIEKVSRYPVDSPVAPPRTSVPRNHPFRLDTGLIADATSVPIFPVIDGDDLKKEAASEEDSTARTTAAVVNLIAIELLKLKMVELLEGGALFLSELFLPLLVVCLLRRATIEFTNFNRSVEEAETYSNSINKQSMGGERKNRQPAFVWFCHGAPVPKAIEIDRTEIYVQRECGPKRHSAKFHLALVSTVPRECDLSGMIFVPRGVLV